MVKYITGLYALNIPNKLNTSGDWHRGAIDWSRVAIAETSESVFGDWGIEKYQEGYKANHLRAVLDMLEDEKQLTHMKSFYRDWISNYEYFPLLKEKSELLRNLNHYDRIVELLERNTPREWRPHLNGKLRKRTRPSRNNTS